MQVGVFKKKQGRVYWTSGKSVDLKYFNLAFADGLFEFIANFLSCFLCTSVISH